MKKKKLKLKQNVKIIIANVLNMSVGITALITMLLSKTTTITSFKVSVLVVLATFIISDLIPDLDIKKDLHL